MPERLSAFFCILAFSILAGTWLLRFMMDMPVMDPVRLFAIGIGILVIYYIVGVFLARLGINLVKEVLEQRRIHEDEKREKARQLYQSVVNETAAEKAKETEAESTGKTPDKEPTRESGSDQPTGDGAAGAAEPQPAA